MSGFAPLTRPDAHATGTTSERLLALILQAARQCRGRLGGLRIDCANDRVADDERGFETASQPLQPARRVDGVADHGKRETVRAADIAEHRRPVIETDADRER